MSFKINWITERVVLAEFKNILKNDFESFENKKLYLAISGGKDSMTLCHLLLACGYSPVLLHCNFQLRIPDANDDEQFLKNYASENHLGIHVKSFDTVKLAEERNLTIQETARNLRYEWFNEFLTDDQELLLTAHHLNDTVETFFINLMRGTGLKGLTGISAVNEQIVRPMLKFSQESISKYVQTNKITFRQDKSNFNNKYLRNKLRNQVIPIIEQESETFVYKVAQTMNTLNEANNWIEQKATDFRQQFTKDKNGYLRVNTYELVKETDFFIQAILTPFGIHRSNHIEFIKLLRNGHGLFNTTKYQFLITTEQLIIRPTENKIKEQGLMIHELPQLLTIQNNKYEFLVSKVKYPFEEGIQQLDMNNIKLPLAIRLWHKGDRIQPLGMQGSKLVSDILINKKINQFEKEKIHVLVMKNEILAIINLMVSDKYKLTNETTKVLVIQKTLEI